MRRLMHLLLVSALASPVSAQDAPLGDPLAPPAAPADVETMDAIVRVAYECISGPAGARDWPRFFSLFAKDAKLIPTSRQANSAPRMHPMSAQEFAEWTTPYYAKKDFYEHEIGAHTDTFGAIAQRFSAYGSYHSKDGQPFNRGINSFQLFNDGKRWYIVTIFWDDERSGMKIPAEYLDPAGH